MNRISNEQREHIVREAIAQRDAILAGNAPRKLWLWKNFVDGKPEYWAFDNPYPVNLTNGDPQTLGEPCGYAIVKPSRLGRAQWDEQAVLRAVRIAQEKAAHPAPAQGERDAEDAARWRMLPAFLEEYQINYVRLVNAIDAALSAAPSEGETK